MYISIVSLSLLNSIFAGLIGRWAGRQAVIFISLLTLIIMLSICVIINYEILLNKNVICLNLYELFNINDISIQVGFLFDSLASIMLLVVIGISTFVHIFTAGYMSHDPYIVKFYSFLSLFTFFMIILVTADNFLQLFIG